MTSIPRDDREVVVRLSVAGGLGAVLGLAGALWAFPGAALYGAIAGAIAGASVDEPRGLWRVVASLAVAAFLAVAALLATTASTLDWRSGIVAAAIGATAGAVSPQWATFAVTIVVSAVMWPLTFTTLPGFVAGALVSSAVDHLRASRRTAVDDIA